MALLAKSKREYSELEVLFFEREVSVSWRFVLSESRFIGRDCRPKWIQRENEKNIGLLYQFYPM